MKKVSPIKGFVSTFGAMRDSALGNEWWRDGALTDELPNGIVVDTIMEGFDTGLPETGVQKPFDEWVIVDQYITREEAVVGHSKWVAMLLENPDMNLTDIGVWEGCETE
jgi:hypothetical protein